MMAWRCLCALALLTVCCFESVSSECLKEATFTKYKDNHIYSKDDVDNDFAKTNGPYKMVKGGSGGDALTTIDGGAIRGKFRKGKILGYDTGFTWYALHGKQYEEASMAYKVKFSPGFEWTKGGKLPGLCGGEGKKGAACPVGCSAVSKDRGFSTRLMWRSGGRVVTYAYYPDKPKSIRCGEDWKWSKKFQSGKWHQINMWSKLNTPGKKDGEFKAWLDGEEVLHKTGIRYRYDGGFKISRSYITTYAGGSSVEMFAPNKDQYIWFKDFETWSGGGSSDCSLGGSNPSPNNNPGSSPTGGNNSGSIDLKGHGTKSASKDISGYVLVPEEAGWDVPGNIGRQNAEADSSASGRDRVVQYTLSCINACNKKRGCAGFSLNADICWFKDSSMLSATPQYKGEGSKGWSWLYARKDQVVNQSGAPTTKQPEIKLALNKVANLHQGACGSFTPLRPEDCSNGNWLITVKWAEEVQGHRLKWWGLQAVDKQEQSSTFHQIEEEQTGICFYWNDSEEVTEGTEAEVTQEQIDSMITITAECESV